MRVVSMSEWKQDNSPHIAGAARCMQCRHEWSAVAASGTTWLECPACTAQKGVFIGPCMADEGAEIWECACGCQIFYITRAEGPKCHSCALPAIGWF